MQYITQSGTELRLALPRIFLAKQILRTLTIHFLDANVVVARRFMIWKFGGAPHFKSGRFHCDSVWCSSTRIASKLIQPIPCIKPL